MAVQESTLRMLEGVNAIVAKAHKKHKGIPETVVVLGASGVGRTGPRHGHFAPKSWGRRGERGEKRVTYGEIMLSGESLHRGAKDTLGTVLHELVHAYCDANDIKDTSNNGRYHNAQFKRIAEEFGLIIDKADTIGWSLTSVPESTCEDYREEIDALEEAISVHRLGFEDLQEINGPEAKASQAKYKMHCPQCQEPLLVTKKFWERQGNGGYDRYDEPFLYGAGLICREHEEEYEIYSEGGEEDM